MKSPRMIVTFLIGLWILPGIALSQKKDALATANSSVGLVGTNPVHCRVTFHSNPATEAILSWSTSEPGTSHRVHYDTISHDGNIETYQFHKNSSRDGRFTNGSEAVKGLNVYYHHTRLEQLQPATTYYCVMESDSQVSREFHFRTGPKDDRKFGLIFGGDSRSGHANRQLVNQFMSNTFEGRPDILAMVHGGDYVATGNNLIQWALWLTHQQATTTKSGRLLPVIPVRGNHEGKHIKLNEVF